MHMECLASKAVGHAHGVLASKAVGHAHGVLAVGVCTWSVWLARLWGYAHGVLASKAVGVCTWSVG